MNDISVPQQYDLETAALKVPPHSIEAEQADRRIETDVAA